MSSTNESPLPAAFERLVEALHTALFPLKQGNRAHLMVATKSIADFRRQGLPSDVMVTVKKRRGKRVSIRGARNYRLSRLVQARWPDDQQSENTVPALIYALRGKVDIHIEDYLVQCPQGNWLFIPAGIAKPDDKLPYVQDNVDRQCDFLWIYPGPLNGIGLECFITHSTSKENFIGQEYGTSAIKNEFLAHLFDELNDQLLNERNKELIHYLLCTLIMSLKHELQEMHAVIPWSRHLDQPVKRSGDIMEEACNHVESHLHRELTINEMAQLLAISPSTFKRRFRSEMGQTFNQYLTAKRIEGAEILLKDTSLSVAMVALKVGFTYERLRVLFHQYHHCSPGEYRNLNN